MLRINNLRCCFLINYKQVLTSRMRLNRKYFSILISYIICSDWHVTVRAFIYFSKMFVLINRQVGFLNEPKIFFYSYSSHGYSFYQYTASTCLFLQNLLTLLYFWILRLLTYQLNQLYRRQRRHLEISKYAFRLLLSFP